MRTPYGNGRPMGWMCFSSNNTVRFRIIANRSGPQRAATCNSVSRETRDNSLLIKNNNRNYNERGERDFEKRKGHRYYIPMNVHLEQTRAGHFFFFFTQQKFQSE